jgi:hypothetical protein
MYQQVFTWLLSITPSFDRDTEIAAVSQYPEQKDELCFFVLFVTLKDTEDEATHALRPAQESRPVGAFEEWFCREDSLEKQYINQAKANPDRHRYCVDNAYIENDSDVVAVLEKGFTTLPHKKAFSLWYAMNPCSRQQLPDMALSVHSDHYFAAYAVWEDEADDLQCQNWVQNTMKTIEEHSVGAYLGDSDFQVRQTRYWSDENAARLRSIRRKWDPEGRVCGYLDQGDVSGTEGLPNKLKGKI